MHLFKLVFVRGKWWNLKHWVIRWFLGSKFSHVVIQLEMRDIERDMFFDAGVSGVEAKNQMDIKAQYRIVHERALEVDTDKFTRIRQFCVDSLNKSYGWLTVLGLVWNRLRKKPVRIGADGNKTFICSELAAGALKIARPELVESFQVDLDTIDPKGLYELVRKI